MNSIRYFWGAIVLMVALTMGLRAYPGKVVKEFPAPYKFSTGLTFDGKYLWVADYKADKLVCVNPENGQVVRQIPSPGFWPMGLAWDGQYLWNADKARKKIYKVDPRDGTVLMAIEAPSANPQGLAWDGYTLWVSDHRARKIYRIDLQDGTAVFTIPAPATYPQGLTFDGTYLWCADRIRNEIYMIDPTSGEVVLIMNSPGPYPFGLAWDGKYLWNVDYQTDKLYRLIRRDRELYHLHHTRHTLLTATHEVVGTGTGTIRDLRVYFAIPENLPQQQILSVSFEPEKPETVTDRWQQKFAFFHYQDIPAEKRVQSKMVVEAKISAIDYFIFPEDCGTLKDIPDEIRQRYTADGSKYQLNHPYIQKTVREVVGDETNVYWMARRIFDFVRKKLEYKLEGGWNTAPVVLQRGTGSCSEYTFSFIALCRAAGIPARYVGSYVVRGDDASLDDVFHRWPEVYLPHYGWIPMDPQGGDRELPRDRALHIGHLSNRFLITTQGGGDSRYMGWYYDTYETYITDPGVDVHIETFGEWEPIEVEGSESK